MLKFILKRIFYLIPTLVLVAAMVFMLIHMIPGDPAAVILGPDATAEDVASVRTALGLDRPLYEQFGLWLSNLVHGDFGVSIHSKRPVIDSIGE
ncbi:MAG: glutathione ABC transporter permease GsiC, partial [Deltaproteobacteria bacterium]|nr:glutathione ABC transporter permease GsiC [Deltaproteobacteria bacterium]